MPAAKRRSAERRCCRCGLLSWFWNRSGGGFWCNVCLAMRAKEERQYLRWAGTRRLVKRSCQMCGALAADITLCWHHIHGTNAPARVQGILCTNCNSGLGYFPTPAAMLRCAEQALLLDGVHFGDNVYDPHLDGPVYVPPYQSWCGPCGAPFAKDHWKAHEASLQHELAVAALTNLSE